MVRDGMRQYETIPCSTVSRVKFHRFGMHSWLIAIIPLYARCLWYVPTIVIESCIVILLISCAVPAVPGFRWIQQSQPAVSIWSIWDPSSRGQGLEAFSAPDVFAEVAHTDHTVHICTHLYTSLHCHRCRRMLPALDTSTQGLSVMDVERHAATHKIFCCEISRCGSTSDIEAVSNRSIALQPVGWSSAGIPGSNFTQAVTAAFSHCMWNFKVEEGQKIEPYWLKPRWVSSYWQLGII